MAFDLDRNANDFHAQYDAGLLLAAADTSARLMHEFERNNGSAFGINAIRAWRVPWCIVPVQQAGLPPAIDDFRNDIAGRLLQQLKERELLSRSVPTRDMDIFIRHWSHYLLRSSIYLHGQTRFREGLQTAVTPDNVLIQVRQEIRNIAFLGTGSGKSFMLLDSPAHPEWNSHRAEQKVSNQGNPIRILGTAEGIRALCRRLLGKNINPSTDTDDPFCDISRAASPELLAVDRGYIAEIECPERTELQKVLTSLRQKSDIETDDFKHILDVVADMWDRVDPDAAVAVDVAETITRESGSAMPDVATDDIPVVFDAYIRPYLQSSDAAVQIPRRLPILKLLAMRTLMDHRDAKSMKMISQAIADCYRMMPVHDRMLELYMLAAGCMRKELHIHQLMDAL